jgi:hypothetical protein
LALCWSRSYGRLALRNRCNLMEHPFEDAVMDRVKRVPTSDEWPEPEAS